MIERVTIQLVIDGEVRERTFPVNLPGGREGELRLIGMAPSLMREAMREQPPMEPVDLLPDEV